MCSVGAHTVIQANGEKEFRPSGRRSLAKEILPSLQGGSRVERGDTTDPARRSSKPQAIPRKKGTRRVAQAKALGAQGSKGETLG